MAFSTGLLVVHRLAGCLPDACAGGLAGCTDRTGGQTMTAAPRPLLLTADTELLDDLLGASTAAGVAVDVAAEPAACRPQWSEAPLVVVGADAVPAVLTARLARRTGVLLAARGSPDA